MFKHRQRLRVKDEHLKVFLDENVWEGAPEKKDFFTRENEWVFQYQEDNGDLVLWHFDTDVDDQFYIDPSWVEPHDNPSPEPQYYDRAEARGC
jgi:hypothetical protein